MRPNPEFLGLGKDFWANIRTLSQELGYTHRGTRGQPGPIKVPTLRECESALKSLELTAEHLVGRTGEATALGTKVSEYFRYRADVLNRTVEPLLMNAEQAARVYLDIRAEVGDGVIVPMNKQSGDKKRPAYFTGIVNLLIYANLDGLPCNYNPQEPTTITRNGAPFRTLSRRVDGAFPGSVDPLSVWEIKEYYHTTTFGSRVADGVYESLLDGMELEEVGVALRTLDPTPVRPYSIEHLLMVDAYGTWWNLGRSYLCRMVDMLHMGYVDEVLFGREVVRRLPELVRGWVDRFRNRG